MTKPPAPPHSELPIPDYDHLPLGSVTSRIRTLDRAGLETVLAYENAHAHRLPVVQALQHRLGQLDDGAQPSGGDPAAVAPEHPVAPSAGSKVSPATSGPPVNPPSQGDPTNPAQPR